jgi:hypothetical protein
MPNMSATKILLFIANLLAILLSDQRSFFLDVFPKRWPQIRWRSGQLLFPADAVEAFFPKRQEFKYLAGNSSQ